MEKKEFLFEGKAKRLYATEDPELIILLYKDDTSAYNGVKKSSIKNKGILNNKISSLIFEKLEEAGIRTHFVRRIDEANQLCKKADVLPLEFIARNVVAGSLARRLDLEEGFVPANPIYEICYKNDDLRDPFINETHALAMNLATEEELEEIRQWVPRINKTLVALFAEVGITVVDFKMEFGRDREGRLMLVDEISPDSARFWDSKTKNKLDKDRFRRDMGHVEEAYREVLERMDKKRGTHPES